MHSVLQVGNQAFSIQVLVLPGADSFKRTEILWIDLIDFKPQALPNQCFANRQHFLDRYPKSA
jgi:hypothetical protein